jgi:hypothetical protein
LRTPTVGLVSISAFDFGLEEEEEELDQEDLFSTVFPTQGKGDINNNIEESVDSNKGYLKRVFSEEEDFYSTEGESSVSTLIGHDILEDTLIHWEQTGKEASDQGVSQAVIKEIKVEVQEEESLESSKKSSFPSSSQTPSAPLSSPSPPGPTTYHQPSSRRIHTIFETPESQQELVEGLIAAVTTTVPSVQSCSNPASLHSSEASSRRTSLQDPKDFRRGSLSSSEITVIGSETNETIESLPDLTASTQAAATSSSTMIMEGSLETLPSVNLAEQPFSLSFDSYKLECEEEEDEEEEEEVDTDDQDQMEEPKIQVDDDDDDKDVMRKLLFDDRSVSQSPQRSPQESRTVQVKKEGKEIKSGFLKVPPPSITVMDSCRRSSLSVGFEGTTTGASLMTMTSNSRSPNVLLTPNLDSLNTPATTKESEGLTSFFGSHIIVTSISDPVPIITGKYAYIIIFFPWYSVAASYSD